MNISLLKLKNCLGVKELEFKPGKITIIQGAGKQGKTSILDSIERTLYNTGKRPQFVFGGADKAETYLVLDDGTQIKKNINKEGKVTNIKIEKDGMSPKAPEAYLKNLVGEKQLNPVEFITKGEKEQIETILSIVSIAVTEDDIKSWIGEPVNADYTQHGLKVCKQVEDALMAKRKDINKERDMLKADVENLGYKLPATYNVEDWREVSLTEKYEKISEANKLNSNIERGQAVIDNYDAKVSQINSGINLEIAKLEEQIEQLKKKAIEQAAEETTKLEAAKKYVAENKVIDILPLEEDHKNTELMKSYIRIADELKDKKESLEAAIKDSDKLTSQIETIRKKPQELLSKAEMPITGLSVDKDGNILINNLPIKNLCGTEKIEFAVEVAKATAKDLKLILVDGLEALTQEDMNTFIEKCRDDEFQYIMTRVTSGELNIVNEDGELLNN
jgi:DNA repair exonuclease SbcCD ATPase subunit